MAFREAYQAVMTFSAMIEAGADRDSLREDLKTIRSVGTKIITAAELPSWIEVEPELNKDER